MPRPRRLGLTGRLVLRVAVCEAAAGCSPSVLPDPQDTVAAYAAAVSRGDARAVHALLSEEARRGLGESGTAHALSDTRTELGEDAKSALAKGARVRVRAEVRFVDGEVAVLEAEQGRFRVAAASGLPAAARTPAEALGDLRGALARRSYSAMLRALSTETRGAVEADLESLVQGLKSPETLDVKRRGDSAEVELPGGHRVLLKREAGVWRVHDFD